MARKQGRLTTYEAEGSQQRKCRAPASLMSETNLWVNRHPARRRGLMREIGSETMARGGRR